MIRELIRPPDAEAADQAVELLRGWIIDGQPQYALLPSIWKNDLASWGRFLADTARHLTNAIAEETGRDASEILGAIVTAFWDEVSEPTNEHDGQFHERDA